MNEDKEKTPAGRGTKAIVEEADAAEARAKAVARATATLDQAAKSVTEAVNRAVAAAQVDADAWKAVQEGAWPAELARAGAVARAEEWKAVERDAHVAEKVARSAEQMVEGVDATEDRVVAKEVEKVVEVVGRVAKVLAKAAVCAEKMARMGKGNQAYATAQVSKSEARSKAWAEVKDKVGEAKNQTALVDQAAMGWSKAWATVANKVRANDEWVAKAGAVTAHRASVEMRLNEAVAVAEKAVKAIVQATTYYE